MPQFSKNSQALLDSCHADIQRVMYKAIEYIDFKVICGHRGQADQDACYYAGTSNVKYPDSRHNSLPALAVDIVPYPVDWADHKRFYRLAGVIQVIAADMGVPLTWGGDWKNFIDLPHWELPKSL